MPLFEGVKTAPTPHPPRGGGAKTVSTGGRGRGRGGRKGRETARGRRKGIADRVGQGSEGEGQGTVGHCTFSTVH